MLRTCAIAVRPLSRKTSLVMERAMPSAMAGTLVEEMAIVPLGGWYEETSDGKLRDSGRTAIARSTTNQVLRDRGRTAIARSMTNEVLRDSGLTAIARAPNSCEQNHTYQFQSPLRCGQCLRHVFEEPVANEGRVEFPKSGDL